MAIRPYRTTDLDAVMDVWDRASAIAHSFLPDGFLAEERTKVAERWMPVAEVYVAEEDRIVGFIALLDTEVGAIFVDPDRQGLGVGRSLMDHARQTRPHLELDVFEENEIGRRFYAAYGFRQIGRHVHESTGHTLLRLRRDRADD